MNPVVLGLLIFVPLVQVPLVLWLGRFFAIDEDYDPPSVGDPATGDGVPSQPGDDATKPSRRARPVETENVLCWACGPLNDPTFSYCRDCLTALG